MSACARSERPGTAISPVREKSQSQLNRAAHPFQETKRRNSMTGKVG
jgi:hypothetical protein